MESGSQFIDIILFAMVAAFLVLRLRSVLGRRNGSKTGHRDIFAQRKAEPHAEDNVIAIGDQKPGQKDSVWNKPQDDAAEGHSDLIEGIAQIRRADPSFDPDGFVGGAKGAFDMILTAFSSGDKATLKGLLSAEVYGNFAQAINDRERQGHTLEDTLVGIKSAELVEAYMEGRNANVTVKFVSEQITVTRDKEGQIVEGNPNTVTEVTDFWTFARDTRSRDPNWELVATRSLD